MHQGLEHEGRRPSGQCLLYFRYVDSKGKQQLIGQIQFFWKLVPDLKWDVQEMIESGDEDINWQDVSPDRWSYEVDDDGWDGDLEIDEVTRA